MTVMKSKFILISGKTSLSDFPAFIVCAICFMSGCVLAIFFADYVADAETLSGYMSAYFTQVGSGGDVHPGFGKIFLNTAKYHIAAVFFGFSVIGFICIPLLSAVRGFFFTFSIAVIIRLYGGNGILLVLGLFGINALIALPSYFVLAAMAFSVSKNLFSMAAYPGQRTYITPFTGRYFTCCAVCLGLLLIAAVTDTYLTVYLVQLAAKNLI